MIRVERGSAPSFVLDPEFQSARDRYADYQGSGGSRAHQSRLEAARAMGASWGQAADYAYQLFHGKCAYTEVPTEPRLHLHRPESDAMDERERVSPNHYWWTAFWYRNWYVASHEVEAHKRNNFPVLGARAPEPWYDSASAPQVNLLRDERLEQFLDQGALLDPCEDHPQLHLRFFPDGTVRAWANEGAPWLNGGQRGRGAETIRLLGLDSPQLVNARLAAVRMAGDLLSVRHLSPDSPHLGSLRQVVAERLFRQPKFGLTKEVRLVLPELVPLLLSDRGRAPEGLIEVMRRELQSSAPDLADLLATPRIHMSERPVRPVALVPIGQQPAGPPNVIARGDAIVRVLIKNFQAIKHYELDIPVASDPALGPSPFSHAAPQSQGVAAGGAANRPWRMFLGDNGSGKSSALRAIALALSWRSLDTLTAECHLRWSDLLRRGTREGEVHLEFSGGGRIELHFTKSGPTRDGAKPTQMDCYVRGFGATHLATEAGPAAEDLIRVGNLLDPRQTVVHAEQWLLGLRERSPGDFNAAGITIASLLGQRKLVEESADSSTAVTGSKYLEVVRGEVRLSGEPLRTLSDGYRAVISLACDLMAGPGAGLSDLGYASGIVLIDELGCYLHPKWKVQITRNLREVFRSMQFFATTHEPLCLRGLTAREVVRVTPSADKIAARRHAEFETVEQSPSDFRVDRLLTSSFFGLDTTIDVDVEQQFLRYYQLIRDDDPVDEDDRKELRASLSRYGILGYTRRDQLIYDAIDEFLAKSPQMTPETRRRQRQLTLEYVADIWRNVAVRRQGGTQP